MKKYCDYMISYLLLDKIIMCVCSTAKKRKMGAHLELG